MLNLKSNRTMWSQTSRKVTHPHTTPARARLTLQFYPTPAPAHLTDTCWYIYHINPIKPCWCLGLCSCSCSCSWVWWNFEKIFQTSRSYYVSYFEKHFQKNSKPFFSVTSGAPSKWRATSKFELFSISPL